MKTLTSFLFCFLMLANVLHAQAQKKWTPPPVVDLQSMILEDRTLAAETIRGSWGEKSLRAGTNRQIDKRHVLWAVMHDQAVTVFNKQSGKKITDLVRLDETGLQAASINFPEPVEFEYELKTKFGKVVGPGGRIKLEYYDCTAASMRNDSVPQGKIVRHTWKESKIFPNTHREYEVYIPAQYDGSEPAALMIFQDGLRHADTESNGGLRVPVVFDNLIAAKKMPVTIGIFINPGRRTNQKSGAKPGNRSFEYDSLGDAYVRFLLEEIVPQVEMEHGVKLSDDPSMRAIAGGSSGCSCAWTAAWERPDKFGKVLGWVGSFVDLRGGHNYPPMIRKNDRKPIRTALLGEMQDLDNDYGNWPLANQQMQAALKYKDYDFKYWWGTGFHGSRHAAVMLPEMLEWLWAE